MANDDKQTGANLASSGVVLAALAVAGTSYLVGHEAPLRGSRPAMTEPQFHQSVTGQDIDAQSSQPRHCGRTAQYYPSQDMTPQHNCTLPRVRG
jgi:hypothetical protein